MSEFLKFEDFLRDDEETKVITLDCFKLPEGMEPPTITIKVNDETRKIFKRSIKKNNNIKPGVRIIRGGIEAQIVDKKEQFCEDILKASYVESSDFDSVDSVLQQVLRYSKFAKYLASAIIDIFEAADKFKDDKEADDEKN